MEVVKKHLSGLEMDIEIKRRVVLMNTPSPDVNFVKSSMNAPHYYVTKNGTTYHLFNNEVCLNCMVYNEGNIYVAFENLSMLSYKAGVFYNIYEKEYNKEAYEKPWKGFKYWDNYTDHQYLALNQLLSIFNIKGSVKNSLEYTPDIVSFDGVCSRANFSSLFYDVTPAFEFERIYY